MPGRCNTFASVTLLLAVSFGTATPLAADGKQTKYTILHDFKRKRDGHGGSAGLIRDSVGNLYGMAPYGGANNEGAIFQLTPSGTETILYSFSATGQNDGRRPSSRLLRDAGGNLYGTTSGGGPKGLGTAFKLRPNGTLTVLHAFGGGSDGIGPVGLVRDESGDFYGATYTGGGATSCNGGGCGTVFKIAPDGTETILYAFPGPDRGFGPNSVLVRDKDGNIYGTTENGGGSSICSNYGCGVVFKLAPDGGETVLHAFAGDSDGAHPSGDLIQDGEGSLYGTAYNTGDAGRGVVFEITADGSFAVLHAFAGGTDGAYPEGGVIRDSTGNLYGTTSQGGTRGGDGWGVVFRLASDGTLTVLHDFNGVDGMSPAGSLFADKAHRHLYGTTSYGGAHKVGVIFELNSHGE